MDMFFIKVTDALTGKEMIIRGDLIFKIEETVRTGAQGLMKIRHIQFVDGASEYVTDTMDELIETLVGGQDD
jgi:hypothetical protein